MSCFKDIDVLINVSVRWLDALLPLLETVIVSICMHLVNNLLSGGVLDPFETLRADTRGERGTEI